MDARDWKKIKEVFTEIVELPTSEREEFLNGKFDAGDGMRLEVEKMLAFDDEAVGDDHLEKTAFEHFSNGTGPKIPENIGEYKIVREIGRGGMGAVYEAIRSGENFTQRVALKVIKRGMDTDAIVSRFRHEQQILSTLEHPNIARFLDGGMTEDNLPFYAMEFVEGEFIDDYCQKKDLRIDDRLKLFRKVCEAVQFAHQNLIIHRDLKPRNILVTKDGIPKLLDFGIGKIISPESIDVVGTATQFGMMTPDYASPEQIRGTQIGTPSDIYSLGVVLYELLTGTKPYLTDSNSPLERQNAVLETEPTKPSAVQNSKFKIQNFEKLNKDIDTIILKALRKDPNKRYSSVQEFSEDIRRHLEGLPVYARPLTFSYRASKFFKRNKVSVLAGTLVLLSLVTGISVAVWQAFEARKSEQIAEKRFDDVRQLANNVVFKYHDAIADLPGSTEARKMLVTDALKYLDGLAKTSGDNAELQKELARAYLKMGDVQGKMYAANIGDTKGALESYKKSIDLLESAVANHPKDIESKELLIKAYDNYAFLNLRVASGKDAKEVVEKAIKLYDDIAKTEPQNDARTIQLIDLYIRLGDADVGHSPDSRQDFSVRLNHHLKALPLAEELYASDEEKYENVTTLARVYQRLGADHGWIGEDAEKADNKALSIAEYSKSLEFYTKFYEITKSMYELEPESNISRIYMISALSTMAKSLSATGKFEDALKFADKSLKLSKENRKADTANKEGGFLVSIAYEIFGEIYFRKSEFRNSIENFEKALVIDENTYNADKNNGEILQRIPVHHQKLAACYSSLGDEKKAKFHSEREKQYKNIMEKTSSR